MTDERIPLNPMGQIVCWILKPENARDARDDWFRFVARSRISCGLKTPLAAIIEFNMKAGG